MWCNYSNTGVESNLALVRQKGVGPGEKEVRGSPSSPTPWPHCQDSLFQTLPTCRGGKTQNRSVALSSRVGGGSAEGHKKEVYGAFLYKKIFSIRRQILHSEHIWHCFTWNFAFAFCARRSGHALSTALVWGTCMQWPWSAVHANMAYMYQAWKKLKISAESGPGAAQAAASRTCQTTRARLFLALQTELPLGECVSLYRMKFLGKGR